MDRPRWRRPPAPPLPPLPARAPRHPDDVTTSLDLYQPPTHPPAPLGNRKRQTNRQYRQCPFRLQAPHHTRRAAALAYDDPPLPPARVPLHSDDVTDRSTDLLRTGRACPSSFLLILIITTLS